MDEVKPALAGERTPTVAQRNACATEWRGSLLEKTSHKASPARGTGGPGTSDHSHICGGFIPAPLRGARVFPFHRGCSRTRPGADSLDPRLSSPRPYGAEPACPEITFGRRSKRQPTPR